jgi:phage FluMu gp28-like protein
MVSKKSKPAIELYDYQRGWLRDQSRFKIGMFARQTGKTWTTTLEIVQRCLFAESRGGRDRWVILSRGERQAYEALNEGVKRHLKIYEAAFETIEYQWEGKYKALEAQLPNGSRITALPANPDTARGFSANVFLDEFAFHHDSREIWKAMFPIVSRGFDLRITSTPNGKANKFYDLMQSNDGTWSKHQVDIHQAVAQGLDRDVVELRSALADEDAWAQEFELQWLDEASAWLGFELIASCEDERAGKPSEYAGYPCYLGVDIARRNDLWVAIVVERVGDILWVRELVVERRISFEEQEAIVDRLWGRYRIERGCFDQSGMGEMVVERAQKKYGSMVEGVIFGSANKLALATEGKRRFETRGLRIPPLPELRDDLHKLKKSVSAVGTPRFDADRDSNGHADRTWALFLAIMAAGDEAIDWAGITTVGESSINFASEEMLDFAGW